MNFTQMHERLRLELLRRIQRGTLSVSLLARQTGLAKPHLSNFLHSHRKLSLEALDRVLASQGLSAADLSTVAVRMDALDSRREGNAVPLVSHAVALFEPVIRLSAVQTMVHVPTEALMPQRLRPPAGRGAWQRFVAVRIASDETQSMEPVLLPDAIALIDRYYTSLTPYRGNRTNLYAVKNESHLVLRYVQYRASRLVLRPHNLAFPVELIEIEDREAIGEFLAGRVTQILNLV